MGSWAEGTDKQTSASADISKNTEASCEWTSVTKDHHHTTRSPCRAVPRTVPKRRADQLRRHKISCVSPGALRDKSAFYTFCPDSDCLTKRIGMSSGRFTPRAIGLSGDQHWVEGIDYKVHIGHRTDPSSCRTYMSALKILIESRVAPEEVTSRLS